MTKPDNPPSIRLFKSFAHHPVNFRAMLAERTKTMTADPDHARALEVLRLMDGNLTLDEARALAALYVASVEVEAADKAVAGELSSAGFGSSEYTERVHVAKARRKAAHTAWLAALANVEKAVNRG